MEEQQLKSVKVGFIGGGNMASAIGAGLINKDKCWVSTHTDRMHSFWQQLGAHPTLNNCEVLDNCDVVFLAIKPHMLDDVIVNITVRQSDHGSKIKYKGKLFISVLAGVTLDVLQNKLELIADFPRIVRSVPNTPLMVGEGITVYCSQNTTPQDLKMIDTLFSHIGICENVPESLMNAIGGLSGCAPAFAYLIIEALSDGAVRMGVPRLMATKFAAQVLVGAGKMVLETGRHPGQLKDEVCSPGGTTIAGVHAMEVGGVRGSMINAVQAAVKRTSELR
ncbi:pyrroline-5-carboxylate reductase 1, mitochondrial isoform X2 [Odontomachus brunneus]|uniref:pyrroline-5-carboxylate reductase 1, mitochondrial isoform X2 n=1 Tax=Odontomachus brunneus TaxID=486640 RepID=UPI0013F21DB4|nr:pyrroline-5-carboxylate reductase 1, mitochondrial isoform X2 [Odontomachus brunneus]